MRVYLVETENYARDKVAQCLRALGHQVVLLAAPGELAEALARETAPVDAVIADLPAGQGPALVEALSPVHERHPSIPVVLRASTEALPVLEAVRCGVHAYLRKPFRADELQLLLLRLAEARASQSFRDESGLYHRAGFAALARQQLRSARRTKTHMVLLRADVDGARLDEAERAIGELASVVQQTFRDADVAGRVNGTDCGVLLVDVGAGQEGIALARLERNLAAHNTSAGKPLRVRVGASRFDPARPCSFEELVAGANADPPRSTSVPLTLQTSLSADSGPTTRSQFDVE